MELLEAIYIEALGKFDEKILKDLRNQYSMQEKMQANMEIKKNNVVIDYKNIYINNQLYGIISFKYGNLISKTTGRKIVKDLIITKEGE